MKKIKYLFWFLVVWVWLLINQSFWFDFQLVNTQFNNYFTNFSESNYSRSYSYLFRTSSSFHWDFGKIRWGYLWYLLGYDKNWVVSYGADEGPNHSCHSSVLWNKSMYQLDTYNWSCPDIWTVWTLYINQNIYSNPYPSSIALRFNYWIDQNQWRAFLSTYPNNNPSSYTAPNISFWNWFFSGANFEFEDISNWSNWWRLFYNTTWWNKLDSIDFVWPLSSQPPLLVWEFFSNQQTKTNFWYIIDTQGRKWKHFWSYWIGYSFVYNKDSSQVSNHKISWNTLWFTTISDDIITWLSWLGVFDSFVNDPDWNLHYDWLLILRNNQYTSNWKDWTIVISKNPSNYWELLYQEYDCNSNDIDCLFSKDTSSCETYNRTWNALSWFTSLCHVLSQWFLTSWSSSNILPFTNSSQLIDYSTSPILNYLLSSDSTLWNIYTNWNQICFGSNFNSNLCLTKTPSTISIKDIYLSWGYDNPYEYITTWQVQNWTYEACLTNTFFAAVNYEVCHWLNPSDVVYTEGVPYIITDVYLSWTDEILRKAVPLIQYQDWIYTDSYWISYQVCSSEHPCLVNNWGSSYFTWGVLWTWYFDFNNTWLFFKCPFSYTSFLHIWDRNLNIWNFDLLGPVNCLIAWFKHWKSFDFLDSVWLFDFGPLIQWNTRNHLILFRFFDMCIILWLFLFFSLIFKRLK